MAGNLQLGENMQMLAGWEFLIFLGHLPQL